MGQRRRLYGYASGSGARLTLAHSVGSVLTVRSTFSFTFPGRARRDGVGSIGETPNPYSLGLTVTARDESWN